VSRVTLYTHPIVTKQVLVMLSTLAVVILGLVKFALAGNIEHVIVLMLENRCVTSIHFMCQRIK
jgi:phospholipase C